MQDPEARTTNLALTQEQALRLITRLFSAYLFLWTLADITYIPHELLALNENLRFASRYGLFDALHASYSLRYSILYFLENIIRIALWLYLAGWFYRCVPRVHRFFTAD